MYLSSGLVQLILKRRHHSFVRGILLSDSEKLIFDSRQLAPVRLGDLDDFVIHTLRTDQTSLLNLRLDASMEGMIRILEGLGKDICT